MIQTDTFLSLFAELAKNCKPPKVLVLRRDEAHGSGELVPLAAYGMNQVALREVACDYADVQQMGGKRWDTSSLIKRLK